MGEFLSQRWERNQRIAGSGLRWASPPIVAPPPVPRLRGDTPIPFCKISGAQNTAPGFDFFRATGPWCCAKFRPVRFHSRAWFRPAVAEGAGAVVVSPAPDSDRHPPGIGPPVNSGGPGENELEPEGTCSRRRCEAPQAAFWFLFRRGKRNSPKGRNPHRGMKPF